MKMISVYSIIITDTSRKVKGILGGEAKMAQEQFQISQSQSRIFARAIYADISAYVESHQVEYQEFLRQEERNSDSEDQSAHRSKAL